MEFEATLTPARRPDVEVEHAPGGMEGSSDDRRHPLGPPLLSFVCSVGNIPLAAVLWQNGISFGGVIAFIFADLVTIPMVLVYRDYYGWKPALVYAAYLLVTIVVVGLLVDGLFVLVGLAPEPPSSAAALKSVDYFAWDYTTWLNLVFLPLGAWLAWLGTRESGHP